MRRELRAATALALLLVAFALPAGQARAAGPVKQPTSLRLVVASPSVPLGTHPKVTVRMTAGGSPVRGQVIALRIDGTVSREITTGANGAATGTISRDLPAGTYALTATFAGTPGFTRSASPAVRLTVKPVVLVITTVPPIAGLSLLRVDSGHTLTTAVDGSVRFTATKVGRITLQLALPTDEATRRVEFVRWGDGLFGPKREIRIPDTTRLTIGFEVSYPVRLEFSGSQDSSIDPAQVPRVSVTDNSGQDVALTGSGVSWLRANRVSRAVDGLVSTPLEYRVSEVLLGGANVVNRGQQRFEVAGPAMVHVNLLVFNLTVQGTDALFGTPAGSRVRATAPNGVEQVVQLDAEGRAVVPLPRGEYRITLADGLGFPVVAVVSLSRDQAVETKLVSLQDLALVGGVVVVGALGLILIGRPSIIRRRRRSVDDAGH